jgi:hypothetical protein
MNQPLNQITLEGNISHISSNSGTVLVFWLNTAGKMFTKVKSFCPKDIAPDIWKSQYKHLTNGMHVVVVGRLTTSPVETKDPANPGNFITVKNPVGNGNLYEHVLIANQLFSVNGEHQEQMPKQQPANDGQQIPAQQPAQMAKAEKEGLPPLEIPGVPAKPMPWNKG